VSVQGVSESGATVAATLDPDGLPTRYELQLGNMPGLLALQTAGTASSTTPLSLAVGSLSPGTTQVTEAGQGAAGVQARAGEGQAHAVRKERPQDIRQQAEGA
jgi:hypothetical protein